MSECHKCNGRGRIREDGWEGAMIQCSECNGTGNYVSAVSRELIRLGVEHNKLKTRHAKLVEAAGYVEDHTTQLLCLLLENECEGDKWLMERTGTDIVREVEAMQSRLREALEDEDE